MAPKLLGTLILVAGLLATHSIVSPRNARAQSGDPGVCADCHEDVAKEFENSTHGRAFRFGDKAGNCTSCHGAATRHVAEEEVPGDLIIPGRSPAEEVNALCGACHDNNASHAYWEGSEHESAGLSCGDCHATHQKWPEVKGAHVASQVELCAACHKSQQKALTQRSHHPFREGKTECGACHNPHGSGTEYSLKSDSVNDQCYSCHEDKRGPFLWEHSPVREDCLTCHDAHGSNHASLLVTRTAQLCQSCHLQGRHQTVAGTENAAWYVNRQCLNCHMQIHGSNHPSGPLFQR
jgi:DmsE family decaheme c-type cytochrome